MNIKTEWPKGRADMEEELASWLDPALVAAVLQDVRMAKDGFITAGEMVTKLEGRLGTKFETTVDTTGMEPIAELPATDSVMAKGSHG
jgi:hypothetical protein